MRINHEIYTKKENSIIEIWLEINDKNKIYLYDYEIEYDSDKGNFFSKCNLLNNKYLQTNPYNTYLDHINPDTIRKFIDSNDINDISSLEGEFGKYWFKIDKETNQLIMKCSDCDVELEIIKIDLEITPEIIHDIKSWCKTVLKITNKLKNEYYLENFNKIKDENIDVLIEFYKSSECQSEFQQKYEKYFFRQNKTPLQHDKPIIDNEDEPHTKKIKITKGDPINK